MHLTRLKKAEKNRREVLCDVFLHARVQLAWRVTRQTHPFRHQLDFPPRMRTIEKKMGCSIGKTGQIFPCFALVLACCMLKGWSKCQAT